MGVVVCCHDNPARTSLLLGQSKTYLRQYQNTGNLHVRSTLTDHYAVVPWCCRSWLSCSSISNLRKEAGMSGGGDFVLVKVEIEVKVKVFVLLGCSV